MSLKLPEIQSILNELKTNQQTMANPQSRVAVMELDEMLSELELNEASVSSAETPDLQPDISCIDKITALIPQLIETSPQKESLLGLFLKLAMTYRGLGESERFEKMCHLLLELDSDDQAPFLGAEALKQLGWLAFCRGQWEKSSSYYHRSLALFENMGESGYAASVHNNLGYIGSQQGNYDLAKKHHYHVIDIAQERDDCQRITAGAYNSLGIIASVQADWDIALEHFEKSITIYEEIECPKEGAGVYMNLAMAYADVQEWVAAGECYAQATNLAEKSGNLETLSMIYVNRAEFLIDISNIDMARLYSDKALTLFEKSEDAVGIAEVHKLYGRIHRYHKQWEAAINAFNQSLAGYQLCSNPQGEAESCYEFGLMYLDTQDEKNARELLQRSHALYQGLNAADELIRIDAVLQALSASA